MPAMMSDWSVCEIDSHLDTNPQLPAQSLPQMAPAEQTTPAARPANPPQENITAGLMLSRLMKRLALGQRDWDPALLSAVARRLRNAGDKPEQDACFYTNVSLMNQMSHAIEEHLIHERITCDLYVGFQRFSLLRPQLPRYRALLPFVRYLCIYGLNDVPPASEVAAFQHPRLIRFPIIPEVRTDLEWFWFLVVDAESFQTALLAQQLGGNLWGSAHTERAYTGLWTFNPVVVKEIIAILQQAGRLLFYQQH